MTATGAQGAATLLRADFEYVDSAIGGPSHRNNVVSLRDFAPPPGAFDCYATFLHYDASLPEWVAAHNGSVADYRGPCWTPILPFDLDHKHDPADALTQTRRLITWLRDCWDVPVEALTVTFSGAKGFHIELPTALFGGVTPATDLPARLGAMARALTADLDLPGLDWTIYQPLRLWRWPNTRHSRTGCYAIPLTATEALALPMADIVELAHAARALVHPDVDDWIARPELVALWEATLDASGAASTGARQAPCDDGPPARIGPILEGCAWLRHTRDDATGLGEPAWYAMLSILGRCEDGEQLAHGWSTPHPSYSPEETRAKLRHALADAGPRTCQRIRDDLDGTPYCRTCPNQGRISSPIVLGRERERAAVSAQEPPTMTIDTHYHTVADDTPPEPPPPPADGEAQPPVPDGARPVIDTTDEDLQILTRQTWVALLRRNQPPRLFAHGSAPARIGLDATALPVLADLGVDGLAHEAARAAVFIRKQEGNGAPKQNIVHPPTWLIRDLLADPDPPLPPLDRLVNVPVFARDGTLQTEPGYHAASRTFYTPAHGMVLRPVAAAPSAYELLLAVALLTDELLVDFHFTSDADRAHAIALFLLPLVRDLVDGPTPLHGIEASTPGTGKGLLADVLLRPSTGHHVGVIAQAADDAEWRKRITARVIEGRSVLLIDNVRRPLDSGTLSAALTADVWEDRILGRSENVRLPLRTVWVATGNNITYSTEMARRTLRIRLEPDRDRPWEKPPDAFKHPSLREWVQDHRADLVWAGLTIVRAWLAAGRPAGTQTLGSFEGWARVIGGILQVAGIDGFLQNTSQFYEIADIEAAVWREVVAAWVARFRTGPVTCAELLPVVITVEGLDLGNGEARSQTIRLGKQLLKQRDRIVGGHRITHAGMVHHAAQWRLLPIQQALDLEKRHV